MAGMFVAVTDLSEGMVTATRAEWEGIARHLITTGRASLGVWLLKWLDNATESNGEISASFHPDTAAAFRAAALYRQR